LREEKNMGENLKGLGRKEILEQLSLEQLKALASKWWGLKPPYVTGILSKTLKTKKDFVNYFLTRLYTKADLVKAIKKESNVSTTQKRALERLADHRCEACRKKLKTTPDVHHIIPRNEGGSSSDSNLIILCPTCHRKAHSKGYTRTQLKKFIKGRKSK